MRHARRCLLLWLVGATSVGAVLLGPAARVASGPGDAGGWTGLETWYESVGAGPVSVAIVRLVALALAGWLGVAAALQLVATRPHRSNLAWLADRLSPPALRRLVPHAAGLSLAVVLVGPPTPTDPAGTAVMEALDGEPAAPAEPAPPPPSAPRRAPTAPVAVPTPPPVSDEVVVAAGDSFWSLAVDALEGHAPPREVDGYWRRLIEANRDRLVDPTNPDLLYPGQILRLPPPA